MKVAEHSFQVPMANSPLLLNYMYGSLSFESCFFARVKVNHRRVYLAKLCAVAMAMGWLKTTALQGATILVAMGSGKNIWRLKFWRKSPIGNLQI